MKPLPHSALDLVKELEREYPLRNPRLGQSQDEIMFTAGARTLVERLIYRRDAPPEELDTDV